MTKLPTENILLLPWSFLIRCQVLVLIYSSLCHDW